jgi:anti-anti-sigma factor
LIKRPSVLPRQDRRPGGPTDQTVRASQSDPDRRTVVAGPTDVARWTPQGGIPMIRSSDRSPTPLAGEIDINLVAELEPSLFEQAVRNPAHRVVFDCSQVTFIDSSGIAMLLNIERQSGKRVQLANLTPACRRVFEVTGLADRIYEI